jgi:DNA polymerase elongation subunit (family B)
VQVAESTSTTGAWLIQELVVEAERRGMTVVYGDTDSIFAIGVTEQEFGAFVKWANDELFPRLLKSKGCVTNRIKLAYEKEFERLVIVTSKKYAGRFAHYKGSRAREDSKPEVKGLEYKRGDSARLTRALLKRVIDLVMQERCEDPSVIEQVAAEHKARILEQPLDPADVVVRKTLSKKLDAYIQKPKKDGTMAAAPIHVEVARVLEKRGADVGEGARIAYVVVDGSTSPQKAIPAEDWTGECDRHHLWEKLVWPPTERFIVAAFPGHDWGDLPKSRPPKPRAPKKGGAGKNQAPLVKGWFD